MQHLICAATSICSLHLPEDSSRPSHGQGRGLQPWALLEADSQLPRRLDRTGNAEFCAEVTKWAFHERGVLRVSNVHHNKAGLSEQPDWYRITDDLEFALDVHEFSEGSWKPYRWAQALPCSNRPAWPLPCLTSQSYHGPGAAAAAAKHSGQTGCSAW